MSQLQTSDLTDSYTWLKAEALCASLLERGRSFDDLILHHLGTFRRSYRNDVEALSQDGDNPDKLHIEINRDGLYDRLPEGLFHQPRRSNGEGAVEQMIGEYRRFRDEEKSARKFFQPLEQEIFRYAVAVEQAERSGLWGLQGGTTDALFSKLWDLPEGLPPESIPVLVSIMPWAWYIKGNRELTGRALSLILDKPVVVTERIDYEQSGADVLLQLGGAELGVDTVTGSSFEEASLCWVFTIAEVPAPEVSSFISGEGYGKLIRHFVNTFIPLEIDADFMYDIAQTVTDDAEMVLGFSFML